MTGTAYILPLESGWDTLLPLQERARDLGAIEGFSEANGSSQGCRAGISIAFCQRNVQNLHIRVAASSVPHTPMEGIKAIPTNAQFAAPQPGWVASQKTNSACGHLLSRGIRTRLIRACCATERPLARVPCSVYVCAFERGKRILRIPVPVPRRTLAPEAGFPVEGEPRVVMGAPTQVLTLAGTGQDTFSEGIVTAASFNWPWKPISLPNGDILMTDRLNNRIRRITVDQRVEVEAGSGEKSGTDGPALRAAFNDPSYLFKGAGSDIYITEGHGSRLRLLSGGKVTTVAGDGTKGYRDGAALQAQFAIILGGCWVPNGEIFLADNENNRVRVVEIDRTVTSIGTGTAASTDGPKETASFNQPIGMAVDPNGEVYLSERYRIRHIDRTRRVITFAGTTQGDRDGPKETAQFNNVRDLLFAPNSELFLSDSNNHKLKRIDLLGIVTTISGQKDGWKDGPLGTAKFNRPAGLCFNLQGGLLIADCDNARLRIIPDMVSMSTSPFTSTINLTALLDDSPFLRSKSLTFDHKLSQKEFHVYTTFLYLVFPQFLNNGLAKLAGSAVSFETLLHFLTVVFSGTIPDVPPLTLLEIFVRTFAQFFFTEFIAQKGPPCPCAHVLLD